MSVWRAHPTWVGWEMAGAYLLGLHWVNQPKSLPSYWRCNPTVTAAIPLLAERCQQEPIFFGPVRCRCLGSRHAVHPPPKLESVSRQQSRQTQSRYWVGASPIPHPHMSNSTAINNASNYYRNEIRSESRPVATFLGPTDHRFDKQRPSNNLPCVQAHHSHKYSHQVIGHHNSSPSLRVGAAFDDVQVVSFNTASS
jgi:hypothetical protein